MSQVRVFVSHSSADNDFCDALVRALVNAGADVWYDEHSLGAGELLDEIMHELRARPVFIVVLSKAAFASQWVADEVKWAFRLYRRNRTRTILPIVASPIEPTVLDEWLFLQDFRRIEGKGNQPLPLAEAIGRTLHTLGLSNKAEIMEEPDATDSMEDLLRYGERKLSEEEYADALPFFQVVTRLAPDDPDGWYGLGQALFGLRRYQEALVAYDHLVALTPMDDTAWLVQGLILNCAQRYEEAVEAFDRALALDSDYGDTWTNKGYALTELHRYDEALPVLNHALTFGGDPLAWRCKGIALFHLGQYEEAVQAFEQALGGDPRDTAAQSGKSLALRALGRESEAIKTEQMTASPLLQPINLDHPA